MSFFKRGFPAHRAGSSIDMPSTAEQDLQSRGRSKRSFSKPLVILFAIASLIIFLLGLWWSLEPKSFSVGDAISEYSGVNLTGSVSVANPEEQAAATSADGSNASLKSAPRMTAVLNLPKGVATTSTILKLGDILLSKPGGYLSNDKVPPGIYLDNIPNWEFGVLVQLRDATKALREVHSRSQTQSKENPYLVLAEPQLNTNSDKWMFPRAEGEYQEGFDALEDYLKAIVDTADTGSQFYSRADNLRYWLRTVESRLGSLSQLLSASVGKKRLNTDLAGDPRARQTTQGEEEKTVKTPWLEIDDNFYYARGSSYALLHLLKATAIDFSEVLANKNAAVSLQQIIRELEATQDTIYSPIILNGSGFGFVTNHSLIMASYISRANAGIIELRELLAKG